MYVPSAGKCEVTHFDQTEDLVNYLKDLYVAAAADPNRVRDATVVVTHGKVLQITGERARHLELPDGTSVELHSGPPNPEPTEPFALIPDTWLS